jgi:signal transduction histidine kinase
MTPGGPARHYNPAMTTIRGLRYRPSPLLIDAALALAIAAGALWEERHGPFNVWGVILIALPLLVRRRWPLPVFGLVVAGVVIAWPGAPYTGLIAIMLAAYSVGAYERYSLPSLVFLAAVAGAIAAAFRAELPSIPDHTVPFLVIIPLWLVGYALRTRQLRADALADRATRLESEQTLATRAALAEERSRIARELHDVVAHNVSVMVVQAGAALEVLPSSPDRARQALLAIESTGRGAMTELRSLLGVLSAPLEEPAMAPQPGVAQLGALVQQVQDAGLPVDYRVVGGQRPLPSGLDLTVYRIVQEALTNALKHSGLARTEVVLDFRETELKLEILDEGLARISDTPVPAPGGEDSDPGRGLLGIRERVAMYGGTFEAGHRLPHGFAVRVWLPVSPHPPTPSPINGRGGRGEGITGEQPSPSEATS